MVRDKNGHLTIVVIRKKRKRKGGRAEGRTKGRKREREKTLYFSYNG